MGLPKNKTELRIFRRYRSDYPLRIYIGSCPDYSHDGSKYTHEYVGNGIPLLTKFHLEVETLLIEVLEKLGVSYEYIIMVADVEATDEFFCQRFTGGDEEKFLERCAGSVSATELELIKIKQEHKFSGILKSSSFFMRFGRDKFLYYQKSYTEMLAERYKTNGSFRIRIDGDTVARGELYRKMYPDIYKSGMKRTELRDFLISRTLRTMAQYLTLGRLISEEKDGCPVIICHPTKNIGVFNEINRFRLPGDGPQPLSTIPIFEMKRRVY